MTIFLLSTQRYRNRIRFCKFLTIFLLSNGKKIKKHLFNALKTKRNYLYPMKKNKPAKTQQMAPSPAGTKKELAAYILAAARKLPFGDCYVNLGFRNSGLARVLITRKRANGSYIIGFFLVDVFCLGVKQVMYFYAPTEEFIDDLVYRTNLSDPNDPTLLCDSDYAQNIVWGAVEYAEDLGFEPRDEDFEVAQYILDPADEIEFIVIEFGKDGKPFFIAGPRDNPKAINEKLSRLGKENFDMMIRLDNYNEDLDSYEDTEEDRLQREELNRQFTERDSNK
jgi:hypothetical protein